MIIMEAKKGLRDYNGGKKGVKGLLQKQKD